MPRWEPDAQQRLMTAALELFEDPGYDVTTVQAIAERAGLTKSAFFRYFPNKREALFDGESMTSALVTGIASAPDGGPAWDALIHGLTSAGESFMTEQRHDFLVRRAAVIARTPELREREALKHAGLVAAVCDALTARGLADLDARVLGGAGALSFAMAYEQWLDAPGHTSFTALLEATSAQVRSRLREA